MQFFELMGLTTGLEIVLFLVGFVIMGIVVASIIIVNQYEVVIIERLGKYVRTGQPGMVFVTPLLENVRSVNWRFRNAEGGTFQGISGMRIPLTELRYDPCPIACTTSDNCNINVDLVASFHISNATAAAYMSSDPLARMEDVMTAYVYDLIRQFEMDVITPSKITSSINVAAVNAEIKETGIVLSRIHVQVISFPEGSSNLLQTAAEERLQQKSNLRKLELERSTAIAQQDAKLAELKAKQEFELAQLEHQHKVDIEKAVARKRLEELSINTERERNAMLAEFPSLMPLYEMRERLSAYTRLGQSGPGKKVIVLPLEASGLATLPAVNELMSVRARSRSPRRPRSTSSD